MDRPPSPISPDPAEDPALTDLRAALRVVSLAIRDAEREGSAHGALAHIADTGDRLRRAAIRLRERLV